jgi:hypothetical protein
MLPGASFMYAGVKVVEVALFGPAILQRDRALGHQLNESEPEAALDLRFDCEWIHGESHVDCRSCPMNTRSPIWY